MDRELQERVVGAIVLVIVAILIVPVFLDGQTDDVATVSERVSLPGQQNGQAETRKIVLNRDRTEPVPAETAPVQDSVAPPPVRTGKAPVQAPAAEPLARAEDAPDTGTVMDKAPEAEVAPPRVAEATSQTGLWAVQLGSFETRENAESLAAGLREQGYAAFLSKLEIGGKSMHRVRVGPQKDRAAAESIAAQLGKSGRQGQVVPHP